MTKQFTISTTPVQVAASVVPSEYVITFSGPAPVAAVRLPYKTTPVSGTADFTVDGDYLATAGLYDDKAVLLGAASEAAFSVSSTSPTVTADAVGGLTVTDA